MDLIKERYTKIIGIKIFYLLFYLLTFSFTMYEDTFLGLTIDLSVKDLSAGGFYFNLFGVLALVTVITMFISKKAYKISFFTTIIFMILFLMILAFLKEDAYVIKGAFIWQVLLIAALLFAHFKETKTIAIFDKLWEITKNLYAKAKEFIEGLLNKEKEPEQTELIEEDTKE